MGTITKNQDIFVEEVRKLISEGHSVTITAKGYSMNPFIVHLRDQMTISPCQDSDIREGAVVMIRTAKGNCVVHRIIKRSGDKLLLMGDGNVGIKEKALTTDVIGLMTSVTKKERQIPVTSMRWRLYSWFWRILTPVRRYPLGLWRRLHPQEPLR